MSIKTRLSKLEAISPAAMGKPVEDWTNAEIEDYLTRWHGYSGPRPIPVDELQRMIELEKQEGV